MAPPVQHELMLTGNDIVSDRDMRLDRIGPPSNGRIDRARLGCVNNRSRPNHMVCADCLPRLGGLGAGRREAMLVELAEAIDGQHDQFLDGEVADRGNTQMKTNSDISGTVEALRYCSGLAFESKSEMVPLTTGTPTSPFVGARVWGRIMLLNHPHKFAASNEAAPSVTGNALARSDNRMQQDGVTSYYGGPPTPGWEHAACLRRHFGEGRTHDQSST